MLEDCQAHMKGLDLMDQMVGCYMFVTGQTSGGEEYFTIC